jgi:hypothetical protein
MEYGDLYAGQEQNTLRYSKCCRLKTIVFLALFLQCIATSSGSNLGHFSLSHPFQKGIKLCKGLLHMFLTSETDVDSRLKWFPDPDIIEGWPTESRRIIFIRHGESKWNSIFNKGKGVERFLFMPFRIIRGLMLELLDLFTPFSVFLDSPLSNQGISEATIITNLLEALATPDSATGYSSTPPLFRKENTSFSNSSLEQEWASSLRAALSSSESGGSGSSLVLASSNLRRAAETLAVALAGVPAAAPRRVHVLSCLQELSRNIDAMSLAPPRAAPLHQPAVLRVLRRISPAASRDSDSGSEDAPAYEYDAAGNAGDRAGGASAAAAAARLEEFARWCFEDSVREGDVIIAAGHSLWFRWVRRTCFHICARMFASVCDCDIFCTARSHSSWNLPHNSSSSSCSSIIP